MVISSHLYLLIDNPNQSPFNVGVTLELSDFNDSQVADLNRRHGSPVRSAQLPEMMQWLGGHPFLVRQALYSLVDQNLNWDNLVKVATDDEDPFGRHLRYYWEQLKHRPELLKALKQIIEQRRCSDEPALHRLVAAGLVRQAGNDAFCWAGLYEMHFKDKLK